MKFRSISKKNKIDQNLIFERNQIRDTELLQKLFWTKFETFVINTNFWNFKLQLHLKLQVVYYPLKTPDHLSGPNLNFEFTLAQIRNHLKP